MPGTTRQNASPHTSRTSRTSSPDTTTPSSPASFASHASDAGDRESVAAERRQHRDRDHERRASPASSAPRRAPSTGGAHHRVAAERVHVEHRARPSRATFALARSTVVGMSCSLQSRNTGAVRRDRVARRRDRAAQNSSSPILSMPASRRETVASALGRVEIGDVERDDRAGSSGRGITCAAPRARLPSIARRPAQLRSVRRERPALQLRDDAAARSSPAPPGRPRSRCRPARRSPRRASPRSRRRRCGSRRSPRAASAGARGATSAIARRVSGLSAGPDSHPARRRARCPVAGASTASAGGEPSASAPRRRRARRRSRAAPRRRRRAASRTRARATSARPRRRSPVTRSACAPSTGRSRSSSGPDRCTSIAATPARP